MYQSVPIPLNAPHCLWCFSVVKLSRCGRCRNAYYCSKEHQIQHWKVHKNVCRASYQPAGIGDSNTGSSSRIPQNVSMGLSAVANEPLSQIASIGQPGYSGWANMNIAANNAQSLPVNLYSTTESLYQDVGQVLQPQVASYSTPEATMENVFAGAVNPSENLYEFSAEENENIFASLNSEMFSSTNNFWDVITDCDATNFSLNYELELAKSRLEEDVAGTTSRDLNYTAATAAARAMLIPEARDFSQLNNRPMEKVCENVIHDLNKYSICVIDQFLGPTLGDRIEAEVRALFMKGIFTQGRVVGDSVWKPNENIRGDVILWVDGSEPECPYIGTLIAKLDVLMTGCSKKPDNGLLGNYKLSRRTKAMIACYPGNGTHYKKHIDNPHRDGRCVTCIYYLNKNWDTKIHGGRLQMYPTQHSSLVANIDPIFDRMLFFWSDKRNPHEVRPSYAVRFAITVWYYDADERSEALRKYKAKMQQ